MKGIQLQAPVVEADAPHERSGLCVVTARYHRLIPAGRKIDIRPFKSARTIRTRVNLFADWYHTLSRCLMAPYNTARTMKNKLCAAANQTIPASVRCALPANPSPVAGNTMMAFNSQIAIA